MTRHVLCRTEEVRAGVLTPAMAGRMPVVVTLLDGVPAVVSARCPHQGANLAAGVVCDRVIADGYAMLATEAGSPVLRCPWHGFEFDLASGEALVASPAHMRLRLRRLPATVEDDQIVVEI